MGEEQDLLEVITSSPLHTTESTVKLSPQWHERAKAVIAMGACLPKSHFNGPQGIGPYYLVRGEGPWVWDLEGKRYLDFTMGFGPVILGYQNAQINHAVITQLQAGVLFSQPHPLEIEVAELLVQGIPCAEQVRFGKNGSDVTTAALRLARAYTGREHVAYCGYHGWHDWSITQPPLNKGVPEVVQQLSHPFQYNDIHSLETVFSFYPRQIAAVIMEPTRHTPPQPGFLAQVKQCCEQKGALLIFDEIMTGFRFGLGGAQAYFGVTPHLACFGKALANGFPLSALVGQKFIMEECKNIFFGMTFESETLSLAAAKATLLQMQDGDVAKKIHNLGTLFMTEMNALIDKHKLMDKMAIIGNPPRSLLQFKQDEAEGTKKHQTQFLIACTAKGLLLNGFHMPSKAHKIEHIYEALNIVDDCLKELNFA